MEDQNQDKTTTTVSVEKEVKGKLVISASKPTPLWATWIFRTEFWLNKAVITWLSAADIMTDKNLNRTTLALILFDGIIWSAAKLIGISKPDEDKA